MRHRSYYSGVRLLALAAVFAAPGALAEPPPQPRTVEDFVSSSDLVFHGTVVNIEYANSEPVRGEPDGIPHTFVTYRVEQVLHGSTDGAEITLRFMGGLDVDGTYLAVSVTPQFDLGDEDVLFVRGNGESGCPLVADYRGRVRIIDDQAYSDSGRAIHIGPEETFDLGDRHFFPEVATTKVGDQVVITGHDPKAIDAPSDAIWRESLLQMIAQVAVTVPEPENQFASSDGARRFEVPPLTPVELRDSKPAKSGAGNNGNAAIDR